MKGHIFMKATVLSDNIPAENLGCEWGLSIFIEYHGKHILLDAGASGLFLKNADVLGLNMKDVDFGVLSHAHYDHADGIPEFFRVNSSAPFYFRETTGENCCKGVWNYKKYIGIPKGMLKKYPDRIKLVSGDFSPCDGVYLIPHKTPGLEKKGIREHMYLKEKRRWRPDSFSHEQSLVFDTPDGLVIFNSCSHGGADTIIREVTATFPDKKVKALIGGFHLYNKTDAEILALAEGIRSTGISEIYTGHCTGDHAFDLLRETLGESVHKLHAGLVMEF